MMPEEEDAELWQRAREWSAAESDLASLTVPELAGIARREGIDFATSLLYDRLARKPANAIFLAEAAAARPRNGIDTTLIGIVPGAFHREHRGTGADGKRILDIAGRIGCEAEVIPLASFGTTTRNAGDIARWLQAHAGRRIALISLSKGGADVKRALSFPEAAEIFKSVAAWISLSGMVQGTPLVAWLRARRWRWWAVRLALWWRGHDWEALKELRYADGAAMALWPIMPTTLRVVHVCGFPLRRHLAHPWAFRGYDRVAQLGPNDGGGILLGDFAQLPGIVCPIWGADHYLSPPWDALPLLTGIVARALAPESLQASQSENHPIAPPAIRSST